MAFSVSILFHLSLFFIFSYVVFLKFDTPVTKSEYIQLDASIIESRKEPEKRPYVRTITPKKIEKPKIVKQPSINKKSRNVVFYSFKETNADTAILTQIYREPTLNVSIKYPAGWTFIDQNRKNKLDGVTFWLTTGSYAPPPYVHFDVVDKYLFNPKNYKDSIRLNSFTLYYNDPVELEGQVSQEVYIKTDSDEDFKIKLIIKGIEAFKAFQPEFFSMVKSFRFGR